MDHPSNLASVETWLSLEIDEDHMDHEEIEKSPVLLRTTVMVEAIPIAVVVYDMGEVEGGGCLYHFTFRSEHSRPTPISHTGYRSFFAVLKANRTAEELAEDADDFCQMWLEDARLNADPRQMSLF